LRRDTRIETRTHRRLLPLVLLAALASSGLAGCGLPDFMTFTPQVRGNRVDADALKELVPGTSTTKDVVSLIGSPTAHASFDDNTWLYIGEMTKPVIGGTNEVRSQQVVALRFDTAGVLRGIETKTKKDSLPVSVVARTTPSPGTDTSFLQQLLGNVGRFTPGTGTSLGGGPGGDAGRGVTGGY
jgi:outer membrane protein assembly factor BamE (lipoprotein component of BamABCDE complex)